MRAARGLPGSNRGRFGSRAGQTRKDPARLPAPRRRRTGRPDGPPGLPPGTRRSRGAARPRAARDGRPPGRRARRSCAPARPARPALTPARLRAAPTWPRSPAGAARSGCPAGRRGHGSNRPRDRARVGPALARLEVLDLYLLNDIPEIHAPPTPPSLSARCLGSRTACSRPGRTQGMACSPNGPSVFAAFSCRSHHNPYDAAWVFHSA